MTRVSYKCPHCGSADIRWDATGSWDNFKQEVVFNYDHDDASCCDCEAESIDPIEIQIDENYEEIKA